MINLPARGEMRLMVTARATAAALIGILVAGAVGDAGNGLPFRDTFRPRPDAGWRWVREDPKAWRVGPDGLEVRIGLHTGEVEVMGDDVGGIAVHIAARVGDLAEPGEVLVSSTVKDLVAGSGIAFEDAGQHALKGVPDRWRLYRAIPST